MNEFFESIEKGIKKRKRKNNSQICEKFGLNSFYYSNVKKLFADNKDNFYKRLISRPKIFTELGKLISESYNNNQILIVEGIKGSGKSIFSLVLLDYMKNRNISTIRFDNSIENLFSKDSEESYFSNYIYEEEGMKNTNAFIFDESEKFLENYEFVDFLSRVKYQDKVVILFFEKTENYFEELLKNVGEDNYFITFSIPFLENDDFDRLNQKIFFNKNTLNQNYEYLRKIFELNLRNPGDYINAILNVFSLLDDREIDKINQSAFDQYIFNNKLHPENLKWLKDLIGSKENIKNDILNTLLNYNFVKYASLYSKLNELYSIEKNKLSYHLNTLLERNIIEKEGKGKQVQYSITPYFKNFIYSKLVL